MQEDEAKRFIGSVLNILWPDWKPEQANIDLWVRKLRPYEYAECQRIVTDFKAESQVSHRYPPTGKILLKISSYAKLRKAGRETQSVKVYELFPEDSPEQKSSFWVGDRDKLPQDPQVIEQTAERDRERAMMIYGGNWIIVRCWESLYGEQPPKPDDGLRDDAAKEEAHQKILAGQDTPGRRFLESYLKERDRLPESVKELVETVGSKLSEDIPF